MKKEIVINASKDRSRIAIVEDGELVELYVEHPDNVRTLGNIYLGRIRKIMPAIKAAFVDVGQKQDAFLHYSDLTENLPALLAITGEKVPGYEAGLPLAHAPQKRVADDESEPDIEEKLDFERDEEPQASHRSRPRGRGGRHRGNRRRREEEEEQEERPRRTSPFVIDLTLKPGKVTAEPEAPPQRAEERTPPPAEAGERPETNGAAESTAEGNAARAPRRSPSRAKRPAAEPAEAPVEPGAPENAEAEPAAAEAPKPRRGRARQAAPAPEEEEADAAVTAQPEAPSEAGADDEEADTADGDASRRRRRGRRGGRRRSRSKAEDTPETASTEAPSEAEAPAKPSARGRRSGGRRAEAPAEAPEAQSDVAPASAAPAAPSDEAQGGRGRTRRQSDRPRQNAPARRGSGESPEAEEAKAPEAKAAPARRAEPREAKREAPRTEAKPEARPRAPRAAQPNRPEELLRRDGRILVKITKEPISAKGSRVSTDISLAGRFLVLVPAADYVAVSKKIESARERRRLKTLATSLKPDGFGVIVRTVAENRDAKTLDTDLQLLIDKWRKIEQQLAARPEQPVLLYEDVNMVSSIIRDLFTEDYDRILVDDPRLHKNIKAYIQAVAPHMAERVQLHRSNTPVFRAAGLEKAVEQVFSTRVPLPSGGYLFIEHTEAMHVIDVNSGRAGRGKSQAENLLSVNLEAAREVAKQLRLRDLGGIIVVDFIDMRSEADRRKVYQELKKEFAKDRAVTKLLPMSDFGLVEITRQRLRPSITAQATAATAGAAPAAPSGGEGEGRDVAAAMAAAGAAEIPQPERDFGPERLGAPTRTEDVVGRLERWLTRYRAEVPEKYRDRSVAVRVHPLLAGHLRRGFPSVLTRFRFRFRPVRFTLDTDPALHPLDFEVRDEKSGKSLTSQYEPAPAA